MQNRRQLLQSGLAVSAATLVPLRSFAFAGEPHNFDRIRPELFIYDDLHEDALLAAQRALFSNLRVASVQEVFTQLWYDELDLSWRHAPMTLAGTTTARVLHVIETLALDRRMRVVEHAESQNGDLVHWLIAPAPSPALASARTRRPA